MTSREFLFIKKLGVTGSLFFEDCTNLEWKIVDGIIEMFVPTLRLKTGLVYQNAQEYRRVEWENFVIIEAENIHLGLWFQVILDKDKEMNG